MCSVKPVSTSSNATSRLCRDRGFQTRHVADLPRTCRGLSVDYATEDQLPTCRRLVANSAQRGDNIGLDEYSENDEEDEATGRKDVNWIDDSFSLLIKTSEIFVVRQPGVSEPQAFILIQPCMYTRTWDTCWASIHVIYSERLQRQAEYEAASSSAVDQRSPDGDDQLRQQRTPLTVFGHLLSLAVSLAGLIDVGYTYCMVAMGDRCTLRIDEARRLGFVVIATIPESVDLAGHGVRPDLLMAKSIDYKLRQRRPSHVILELANRLLPADECEAAYRSARPPTVAFLPQRYVFQTGLAVVVRLARPDEDRSLYAIMKAAADAGLGYGVDEFPTLDSFRMSMLVDHVFVVFEDERLGKLVGFTAIGKSWYVRTHKSAIVESSLIVDESYRGRGIGGESTEIELSLAVELGYRKSINDWLGSNQRMAHVVRGRSGGHSTIIGTIQHGTFTASPAAAASTAHREDKDGRSEVLGVWDDQIISLNDMVGVRTFSEIARQSRQRAGDGSGSGNLSKL